MNRRLVIDMDRISLESGEFRIAEDFVSQT